MPRFSFFFFSFLFCFSLLAFDEEEFRGVAGDAVYLPIHIPLIPYVFRFHTISLSSTTLFFLLSIHTHGNS